MCAKLATVKQTSGAGYQYEDKAGSYFLLCLLLGRAPYHAEAGLVSRIDFQTAADGWAFDDFLVSLDKQQAGVSVKSAQQFSEEVALADLVKNLWEQHLQIGTNKFDPKTQYCCLVQPPLLGDVAEDLHTLIRLAREQDAGDLDQRVRNPGYVSAAKLKLYDSFSCPKAYANKAKQKNILIGNILARFLFLEFDFESSISKSNKDLVALATDVLLEPTAAKSGKLVTKLTQLCNHLKVSGGYYTLPKLIAYLQDDYSLKAYPDIRADLYKIATSNQNKLAVVKETIGNNFTFDRTDELSELTAAFGDHYIGCLTAPSGYGKSSIAKKFFQDRSGNDLCIWLNATDFEQVLPLSQPLAKIISLQPLVQTIIVIDGLERFYNDVQKQLLAALLNELMSANLSVFVLLTCTNESFEESILNLHQYNFFDDKLFNVGLANRALDYTDLLINFPMLTDLMRNDGFRKLIGNLKLLDALLFSLSRMTASAISGLQATETAMIDLLWKHQVESGAQGALDGNVVKQIAETQADTLRLGVSSTSIEPAAAAALSSIISKAIIYEAEDYYYFRHDLYADWARYKIIRSNAQEIRAFLNILDISSPMWSKAVRQYGIYLLEAKSEQNAWQELIRQLGDSAKEKVVKNLLLESVIFASNVPQILTNLSDFLLADEGKYLKHLFNVILLKATHANPKVLAIAKTLTRYSMAEASAFQRIPDYIYWLPILDFIHRNRAEVIACDFKHTAQIVRDWLGYTPKGAIWRKEMAEIALDLASQIAERKPYYFRSDKSIKENALEALFYAYREHPDRAEKILIKFAQRIPPDENELNQLEERTFPRSFRFRVAQHWPHGPYRDIDEEFRNVCLNDATLDFVFGINPSLGNEILLACLIKEPRDDYYQSGLRDDLDLDVPRQWYPPTYLRGPFLRLLNLDPLPALKGIITLVDFATTQWLSQFTEPYQGNITILTFDGVEKKFNGNHSVYLWYRNIAAPPHSLVSALMAVEKYLYDIRKQNELLQEAINYILQESSSIAFIGLLASVGKAVPALFKNTLKPIIETIEFYRWEQSNLTSFHLGDYGIGELPRSQQETASEWNKMAHRSRPLGDVMITWLLLDEDFKPVYQEIREKWEIELAPHRDKRGFDIWYDRLLSFVDPANYRESTNEGGQTYFEYVEPEALKIRMQPYRQSLDHNQIKPSAFQIHQWLDENRDFTIEALEQLWQLIEELKVRKANEWFNHLETPLSSILGAYIIMLRTKEQWRDQHPEYESIIINYVATTFDRIEKENIEVHNFSVPYDWNNFAPQLIAHIWSLQDNKQVRKWITQICLNFHEESIMRLFSYVGRLRPWNDPGFIQLQNYILRLSAIQSDHPHQITSTYHKKRAALSKKFVAGKLPSTSETWSTYRPKKTKPRSKRGRPHDLPMLDDTMLSPGFTLSLLKAAYERLPTRLNTESKEESVHVLEIWRQAFQQLIYQFGDPLDQTRQHDDYPNDFDLWVLKSIPQLVTQNTGVDFFSVFAESLLAFGYYLPEYVSIYCQNLLLYNLDIPETYPRLIIEWKKIIEYSLKHENWQTKLGHRHEFLHLSIFLLGGQYMSVWDGDYTVFIGQTNKQYKDFFEEYYINPPVTIALCNFAKTVSGHRMLLSALKHLKTAVGFYTIMANRPVPEGKILQPFAAKEQLAKLLSHSWENHKAEIQNDVDAFNAYKELVLFLVAQHHAVGTELQSQLLFLS